MLTPENDDDLMKAVKAGDQKAFSKLVKRHGGAVYGHLLRLFSGDRAKAEDAAQNTWLKVVEKCGTYESRGYFRAWLMTIARNHAISEMRANARFSDVGGETEDLVEVEFDLVAEIGDQAEIRYVKSCIDSLPDSQRMALMCWLEGDLTYEQIAEQLSISLANVKNLIFRAKATLKQKVRVYKKA